MPNANRPGRPRKEALKKEIRQLHKEGRLSFKEISNYLFEKYGLKLTRQGCMYHYHN